VAGLRKRETQVAIASLWFVAVFDPQSCGVAAIPDRPQERSLVMSKFLLVMALGLTSLAGYALAEPPQSPVKPVARGIGPTGWQYFRSYRSRQDAINDGESAILHREARDYEVKGPTRDGFWRLYLLDHQ
jgi:hypothetical protein